MKLSVKSLVITGAILWGAVMLLTTIANAIWPSYAAEFLKVMASVYPGYTAARTFGGIVVGTLYAVVDGGVCGLVFGWIYNAFATGGAQPSGTP